MVNWLSNILENLRSCQTPLPITRRKNRIFKSKKDGSIVMDTPVLDGPPTTKGVCEYLDILIVVNENCF